MPPNPLKKIFQIYIEAEGKNELEVKFFTRKYEKISRIDFDNVIQNLKSKGFTIERPTGIYLLRIQNEFMDRKTGSVRMSNIRTEITSLSNIKTYCKKNSFPLDDPPAYTNFYQKRAKFIDEKRIAPVNYDNFHFRVDLKEENPLKINSGIIQSTLKKWSRSKKNFRFIKRFTFRHKDFPMKVDCSIVKNSNSHHGQLIPAYTIQEAGVFTNPENYEIEIEIDQPQILKAMGDDLDTVIAKMKKVVLLILGAIQETNFPIGTSEQKDVIQSYLNLIDKADIILDSLEWSGLNTSLEAVSFDKPIITLPSKFMRSKHTSAVLKILKIDELICSNKRDYVDMAVKLSINSIFYEDISKKIKMNKKSLFNNYKPIKFLEDFFTTLIKDK